ncbi:MAG: hypothetical protein ACOCRX_05590 [Candidatus Woesearchaeota archaeon]
MVNIKKTLSNVVSVSIITGTVLFSPVNSYAEKLLWTDVRPIDSRVVGTIIYHKKGESTWSSIAKINNEEVCDEERCSYDLGSLEKGITHYFKAKSFDQYKNTSEFSETISYTPSTKSDDNTAPSMTYNWEILPDQNKIDLWGTMYDPEQNPSMFYIKSENTEEIPSHNGNWQFYVGYEGGEKEITLEARDGVGGRTRASFYVSGENPEGSEEKLPEKDDDISMDDSSGSSSGGGCFIRTITKKNKASKKNLEFLLE